MVGVTVAMVVTTHLVAQRLAGAGQGDILVMVGLAAIQQAQRAPLVLVVAVAGVAVLAVRILRVVAVV
jgi:hypothetical protein